MSKSFGLSTLTILLLPLASCELNPTPTADPLTVTAGDDQFATQEQTVTLEAIASGGEPPYRFRWNIESVPDDPENPFDGAIPELQDSTTAAIDTLPFQQGTYVYRVRVTDATGEVAIDSITLNIGETPLRVTVPEEGDDDEPIEVTAAEDFTLTTEINMEGEYTYFWEIREGVEVIISDVDQPTLTVTPVEVGEVTLRVNIRDDETGDTAREEVVLNITQGDAFLVRSDAPDLIDLGQAASITANITNDSIDADSLTYTWEVIKGQDVRISSAVGRTISVTSNDLSTVTVRVTARGTINGTAREESEDLELVTLDSDRPRLIMSIVSDTEGVTGLVTFELFADLAPKTVANLLRYVDEGHYTRMVWHRVASNADGSPFVVQTGGFRSAEDGLEPIVPTRPSVESEADNGQSNVLRTIAMALLNNDPNSGTTQFFVNTTDNEFLDDSAFTVFGEVVDGFDIIEAMTTVETDSRDVVDGGSLNDVPVEDISIAAFRRESGSASDRGDEPDAFR